ncbi:MAG: anhydro-N-acetylmuramic acid kinase [Candidatus Omnitrophica bacterium]|nr:anhydro-N-acetylmuramic acid kinase [Candidatus Omnitrophota bacterium]
MPLALGLMSGTSCDGISAALVRFHGRSFRVLAERTSPYPPSLRRLLRHGPALPARALSRLHVELGERLARAAKRLLASSRFSPEHVAVIGSHGHTIYHGPRDATPSTLQIGSADVIAQRTGIAVVSDFRARDLAAGGEGAPLVPYFDKAFFGHGPARALQNIGGIANVTAVGRGVPTIAFDTGPGICLIDLVAQQMSRGKLRYDRGGRLAARGRIDPRAVRRLWAHPYFHRPPPKSTGRDLFNERLLRHVFGARLSRAPLDVLATVTFFTAYSVAESYRRFLPTRIREVIVSGGGVRNATLMRHLAEQLAPTPVHSIERYGLGAQAKEPVAFAYLALRALHGQINHLPETTGAREACVLGTLTLGSKSRDTSIFSPRKTTEKIEASRKTRKIDALA